MPSVGDEASHAMAVLPEGHNLIVVPHVADEIGVALLECLELIVGVLAVALHVEVGDDDEAAMNLLNPDATAGCEVCQYTQGSDYLRTLDLKKEYYGWRNVGIIVILVGVFYGLVYLMMKLRPRTKDRETIVFFVQGHDIWMCV